MNSAIWDGLVVAGTPNWLTWATRWSSPPNVSSEQTGKKRNGRKPSLVQSLKICETRESDGTRTSDYEYDHLVPLELDGRNSIGNLWPQLVGASRAKDRLENTLHSMVCAGQITLASAQRAIRTNWAHAYHLYVSTPAVPSAAPAPAPPPPASPSAAPPPASCYPTAASGNCYEPGEFCSLADHGMTGVAGDGERIVCQDNNGWRWEPA